MPEHSSNLFQRLSDEFSASLKNHFHDNFDHIRCRDESAQQRQTVRRALKAAFRKRSLFDRSWVSRVVQKVLVDLGPHLSGLERLDEMLEDQQSRDLLVKLLSFRCLGHRHVRLPLSTSEYWRGIAAIETLADKTDVIDPGFNAWELFRTDLQSLDLPFNIYSTPKAIYTQMMLQQYRCQRDGLPPILVQKGDTVIDCGGCWGDTALYFAHLAGAPGSILCYEFIPSNLEIIQTNCQLNPALASRVEVVQHAVWDESDLPVKYHDNGPGSTVSVEAGNETGNGVTTLSIDDLVERRGLQSVNFIKMDIEGAELAALRGARKTIATHRPVLAISVYHHLRDFVEIPDFIASTVDGYQYYLRHFTIHREETVLFAAPIERDVSDMRSQYRGSL